MHNDKEDATQPPENAISASFPANTAHINLLNVYLPPAQQTLPGLQNQFQMPANAAVGNGQPRMHGQHFSGLNQRRWQFMQTNNCLQNQQMGFDPQDGSFWPPQANVTATPAPAAPRNPPHRSNLLGNHSNTNVPAYDPTSGVSVGQPSTLAEFLSSTGNNNNRLSMSRNTMPGVQQARQEQLRMQQMYREMIHARQLQDTANHHQLQQQQPRSMLLPPQPLPPPQQQQQQPIQQFAVQMPPRPPPPPPFLNAFSLPYPIHHPFISNTVAIAAPVLVPQNNPLQVPQQPVPTTDLTPTSTPASASNLAAAVAADLFPSPDAGDGTCTMLAPPYQNMGMLVNEPSGLKNALPLDIEALQKEQEEYVQQQLIDDVGQLPIPVEIQQQINGSVVPDISMEIPIGDIAVGPSGNAMDMEGLLANEQEQRAAEEQRTAEELAASKEEARQQAKREHRRVQNAANKRKQRQRCKEEEDAERNALEKQFREVRDELICLTRDNSHLTPSIIARVKVLHVRDAMLKVLRSPLLLPAPQGHVPLLSSGGGLVESDVEMTENNGSLVHINTKETHLLIATTIAAAAAQEGQEQQQKEGGNPSPPQVPTPSPPTQHQQVQLNTFEIAESLAHTDIDVCVGYTRQLLVDVTSKVEEAFEEKLPPELVASIEDSIVNSRAVYKRVRDVNKSIYYAHVYRLSENAIVAAAQSKKAAVLLLDLDYVSEDQLMRLRDVERKFTLADIEARNALHASQIEVMKLLHVVDSDVSTAGGACHSVQARKSVEVATCIEKWERFFGIRQNFIIELEEIFFKIMGPFNYAIVLSKSQPCFPNWGRVIEEIVNLAKWRQLIPDL